MSDVCLDLDVEISGSSKPEAWSFSHVLVDWLTIRQPNDGSFAPFEDGAVWFESSDGEIRRVPRAGKLEGSFDSRASLRITADSLELSFNPSRWNRADNVFGCSFERALAVANGLLRSVDRPPLTVGGFFGFVVTRLDVTVNLATGGRGELDAYLRFLRRQTLPRMSTFYRPGSVTFSNKSKRVVVYDKASEMRAHGLSSDREAVADWCEQVGLARVELRLHREFLRRNGLRRAVDLSHARLVDVLRKEVVSMPTECTEEVLDKLTEGELGSLLAWQRGFDVRKLVSHATFYRRKKAIKAKTGYDIGADAPVRLEPKPVSFEVREALPPDWYELPDVKEA